MVADSIADCLESVLPSGNLWADTLPIVNCGFPIGFFRYGLIGNRQFQIANRLAHLLPPGGTDLTPIRAEGPNRQLAIGNVLYTLRFSTTAKK